MRADDLLDALGEINPLYIKEAEQMTHQKRKIFHRAPAAACVLLLLFGSSYGIWKRTVGDKGVDTAAISKEMAAAEGANEAFDSVKVPKNQAGIIEGTEAEALPEQAVAESAEEASAAVWHINEVEELMYTVSCGVEPVQKKYYTAEELQEYYGILILPEELPQGYELSDSDRLYEIGYDTVGNVVEDNCTIVYENPQTGGMIQISARTVDIGESVSLTSDALQQSLVGDMVVTAVHYLTDSSASENMDGYLAVYEKEGVTVTVNITGASEEVFCAVAEQLLLGKEEEITVIHEPYKLLE